MVSLFAHVNPASTLTLPDVAPGHPDSAGRAGRGGETTQSPVRLVMVKWRSPQKREPHPAIWVPHMSSSRGNSPLCSFPLLYMDGHPWLCRPVSMVPLLVFPSRWFYPLWPYVAPGLIFIFLANMQTEAQRQNLTSPHTRPELTSEMYIKDSQPGALPKNMDCFVSSIFFLGPPKVGPLSCHPNS